MTGEVTLRGRVLPVGGIKEKSHGSASRWDQTRHSSGENERDLDEIPDNVRDDLEFIVVQDMTDVLHAALEPLATDLSPGDSAVTTPA